MESLDADIIKESGRIAFWMTGFAALIISASGCTTRFVGTQGDDGGPDSSLSPVCGNGVIDEGEECDGTDFGGQTCESLGKGFSGGELSCTDDCLLDTFECILPHCGDGILDLGEECDHGEQNSNSGECLTNCRKAVCGDGFLWIGVEECDDGPDNSDTEPGACRTDCKLPHCGDGVVDPEEECDDGPDNSDTEPGACRTDCRLPHCGDGVVDPGEECDDGPDNSDTEPGACRTDCTLPYCGDGIVDPGEECDDGPNNSNTQPGACRTDCTLPPPHWSYTHWRVDQPDRGSCTHWGKIAQVRFRAGGVFLANAATGYTTGTVAGKQIVAITHSGDSAQYGRAWHVYDGTGEPWQTHQGTSSSYFWQGNEFLILQVSSPIAAESVRVGSFWGSTTCVRLSGSNNGTSWDILGTMCNTDCSATVDFAP